MDFDAYQKAALRTASPLTTERDRLLCGQAGLCGESGEVADIIKKFAFHGHPLDRDKVAKELGDVMWYISLLSDAIGMTMGQIAALNIEKLKARYPDGFSTERSMNREGEARPTIRRSTEDLGSEVERLAAELDTARAERDEALIRRSVEDLSVEALRGEMERLITERDTAREERDEALTQTERAVAVAQTTVTDRDGWRSLAEKGDV